MSAHRPARSRSGYDDYDCRPMGRWSPPPALALLIALFTGLFGTGPALAQASGESAATGSGDDLVRIQEAGRLRAGTRLLAPFAMRDAAGTLIGHEIDLALGLAADLDVEAEVVPLLEEELVPALKDGLIDIVIAAFAITPARAREASFTSPYASAAIQLVSTRSAARRNRTAAAFNRPGLAIGVARNSPAEREAVSHFPDARLQLYRNAQDAKDALLGGSVDLLVSETPFPEVLVVQSPDRFVLALDRPLGESAQGFAIRQGNPDLLAFLNAWILARTQDDFLVRTRAYWFGSTDWVPRLTEPPRIDRIETPIP